MRHPHDIDLTETAPGEWERQPPGTDLAPVETPNSAPPRRSAVDDIPNLGSPIEFFAMFGCLWFLAWLLRG